MLEERNSNLLKTLRHDGMMCTNARPTSLMTSNLAVRSSPQELTRNRPAARKQCRAATQRFRWPDSNNKLLLVARAKTSRGNALFNETDLCKFLVLEFPKAQENGCFLGLHFAGKLVVGSVQSGRAATISSGRCTPKCGQLLVLNTYSFQTIKLKLAKEI